MCDTLGIDGGANVYAWANMNPVWFVDPYGLEAMSGGAQVGAKLRGALNRSVEFTQNALKNIGHAVWTGTKGAYIQSTAWHFENRQNRNRPYEKLDRNTVRSDKRNRGIHLFAVIAA